jgi:hypothetical protein
MDTIIAAPASCEVRAVIRFLHTEGQSMAEIHRWLCRVYGDNIMSDSCVREWCRKFRDGRTDVNDIGGQEWHSIVTVKIHSKSWPMLAWKTLFHNIKTFWRISTNFEDYFVSNCHGQIGLPYFLCTVGTKTSDQLGCLTWQHRSLKRDYKN